MLDTATDLGYGDRDLAALHQMLATIDPQPSDPATMVGVA
jgi:hypothetical protein